jgi:hypothetical protein
MLYDNSLDNVQHICEIDKLAENQPIEKKQFVPYTFSIPFLINKNSVGMEIYDFFNFQVDNNLMRSLCYVL